jgi:quercetin dioxygenase-like cupin family protein
VDETWRTITNPATGEDITFEETSGETVGLRTVMRLTLAPGGAVQAHSHRSEETFECTDGQLDFVVDGKALRLEAGATISAPPGRIHSFRNTTDTAATVRVTVTPAGDIERSLRTVFALVREGRLTPGKPPKDPLIMARLVIPDHVYLPPLPRPLYWPLMYTLAALGGRRADTAIARYADRR